jgi:hypothetical protein
LAQYLITIIIIKNIGNSQALRLHTPCCAWENNEDGLELGQGTVNTCPLRLLCKKGHLGFVPSSVLPPLPATAAAVAGTAASAGSDGKEEEGTDP